MEQEEKLFPRVSKTIAFAGTTYSLYNQTTELYRRGRDWYNERYPKPDYTVIIDQEDQLFVYLTRWLFDHVEINENVTYAEYNWELGVDFRLDITSAIQFELPSGALVNINKKDDEPESKEAQFFGPSKKDISYRLTVEDAETREELAEFLKTLPSLFQTSDTVQNIYTKSVNGWNYSGELVKRDIDSVHLDEGVLEALLADIELFAAEEETYNNLGIPWHRGYLLHGPPGNGKTSIVKALATLYNRNVYQLSLSDVKADSELIALIGNISRNSILLIEDIDAFDVAKERKGKNKTTSKKLTISGLLNGLDGIQSLHGCIIIMTSNFPEHLDEALMRPGRIDQKIEITNVTTYQLANMIRAFTGKDEVIDVNREVSAASIVEVFKTNIRQRQDALAEVKELVS